MCLFFFFFVGGEGGGGGRGELHVFQIEQAPTESSSLFYI